jgi:hypothetical protein
MTDEPTEAIPWTSWSPGGDEPDEDVTLAVIGEVLKAMDPEGREDARTQARRANLDQNYWHSHLHLTPDDLVIGLVLRDFAKAYIDALLKRAADGTFDYVGRIRFRRRRKSGETRLGVDGGAAATVVVTEDLPDEARLALLDLDVTTPELRGKELRWDKAAEAWRPSEPLSADPSETAPTDLSCAASGTSSPRSGGGRDDGRLGVAHPTAQRTRSCRRPRRSSRPRTKRLLGSATSDSPHASRSVMSWLWGSDGGTRRKPSASSAATMRADSS